MNDFDDQDLRDDGEIEFADLPEENEDSISGKLFRQGSHLRLRALGARLSSRPRLRRLAMAGSTVLLALLLLQGSFPAIRDWTYNLFARAAPTSTYEVSLTEESPMRGSSGIGPNSSPPLQATAHFWDSDATPGPAPGGQSCPASPVYGSASEVGRPPARVFGFDGPRATLHLFSTPVPVSAFPRGFGWAAAITVEIASDYTELVSLDGKGLRDGSPLLFGFERGSSQVQLLSLTLSTYQAMVSPGHPGLFKARRPVWNIRVFVPSAGCYFLQAAWPGGNWGINFAAGE